MINQQTYSSRKIRSYHWSKLSSLPRKKHLIKGLLDHGGMSVVFGQSNSGKTFFALDIAAHISLGLNWRDLKTKKGEVIYIAAEGGLGVAERLRAFQLNKKIKHYGDINLIPHCLNLCSADEDVQALIDKIKQEHKNIKLIVVDTLSRVLAGGNENSPDDMGSFIANCDAIRQATQAHLMIVHHSGKDTQKGARGHSSLRAAVDTEIEIKQSNGIVTAEITKQRDGKTDQKFCFELQEVKIGNDEENDPIYSCSLEATEGFTEKTRLSGQARQALQCLLNLSLERGKKSVPKKGMSSQTCVTLSDFKDYFIKAGIADSDIPDSVNKAFIRAKNKLKSLGYIGEWDGQIWLLEKEDSKIQTQSA